MILHDAILADATRQVGDIVEGFKILKLDRANKVVELQKLETALPLDGVAGQVVTLLADKTYGLSDPVKITIEAKNLYSGIGKPTDDIGTDGDYFEQLDAATDAFSIWGAKADGKWPAAAQYKKITDYLPKITALETDNTANKTDITALKTGAVATTASLKALADTDTDLTQRMVTAENLLGKKQAIRLNRLPTNTDIYETGTVWEDISFGDTTPLRLITTAPGVWVYQNAITLTKIRLYCAGRQATYRSSINNVRFYKPDDTQIPNSWFVWGGSSGIDGGGAGVAYNGQQIYCGYNASGWVDIEVSSKFDPAIAIGKVMGNMAAGSYASCSRIEFWYSNGSKKAFTGCGYTAGDVVMATCDPAVVGKYGDAIAAAQGEMLTAAKLADATNNDFGRVSGAVFDSAFTQKAGQISEKIAKLEARKEVMDGFVTTVLVDGKTLPETTDFPRPSASGFSNDGEGDVAGATSWTNNAPIGVNIGQSGNATDEYEISVGFGAANPIAQITFRVGDVFQDVTANGVQAGTLDITEFNTGNWRGATLKVTGNFTGMVAFNTRGSTYIGPVIRKRSKSGFAIENQRLALLSDIPTPIDTSGFETKTGVDTKLTEYLKKTDQANVDLSGYLTKADILKDINAGYTKLDELWLEFATMGWVNSQLDDINGLVNSIPDRFQAKGDYALKTEVPAAPDLTAYAKKTDIPALPDLSPYATTASLNAEAKARQDSDTAIYQNLTSYNEILFQHQEELAAEVTARGAADTALDSRLDIIETNLSKVRSVYLGTFDDQAGNTGHQFTQKQKTGNGITTTDNITFTLSGGIYRVEAGIMKHMAANTWRMTVLQVNGTSVESMYSGHDGGNWNGSGPMVRYIDASTSPQTVKIVRTSSTGNGNACGFLDIRQEAGIVAPTGTVVVTPRVISGSITGQAYEELDWPAQIALANGEILASLTLNGVAVPFNALSGLFIIPKGKGNVVVAHTTKAGATYQGLQQVEFSTATLSFTNTDKDYIGLSGTLQEGDLLEIQHQFNGNIAEREMVWVRVQAGSVQRQFPWADPTNNTHYFTFPSPLTNRFKVKQSGAGSAPSILSVKVWRDAANGYVIPTGTVVVTSRAISGSISGQAYEELDWPARITLNAGEALASVSVNGVAVAFDAVTGFFVIPKGVGAATVSHTTKAIATYTGLQKTGEWTPAGGQIDIENLTITANIDLRQAKYLVIGYRDASVGKHWQTSWFDLEVIPDAADIFWGTRESGYGRIRIDDRSIGKIWLEDDSGGIMLTRIEAWADAANGLCIPTATTLKEPCLVKINDGSTTIEGQASKNFLTATWDRVKVDCPNGREIDTATLVGTGATVEISGDRKFLNIYPDIGKTAINITVTFKLESNVAKLGTQFFALDGGVVGSFGPYDFQMAGSGNRSMMIRSNTGAAIATLINTIWNDGGNSGFILKSVGPAMEYVNNSWSFGTAGQWQEVTLSDNVAKRIYRIRMTVSNAYAANQFICQEL